jgi:hypothetical protein
VRLSPVVSIKAPGGQTMNSLPWTMCVSIRRTLEVITATAVEGQGVISI